MEKLVPIVLILLSSLVNISTSCCVEKERMTSFLDAAVDMISKAKAENISCKEEHDCNNGKARDCADLYKRGFNKSGVYAIYPINRLTSAKRLEVYCDMTKGDGGWTVIQRRGDFKREDDYFNKPWEDYKKGFGTLEKDFWMGNDNIFAITNQKQYSVRFDLEAKSQDKAYAHYDSFWIDDEFNAYTLHISGYSGTAGNSMKGHDKMKFSTKDRDNDIRNDVNCAEIFKSGWWFLDCFFVNLNGIYNDTNNSGIIWKHWKGTESLVKTEIKIRPSVS